MPPEISHEPTPGARPVGVTDPNAAAEKIQRMFDAIAPTYDRANHLLSFGLDRTWWLRAARVLRPILQRPEAVVLDLCCGTGDMTLALYRHRPPSRVPHDRRGAAGPIVGFVPLSERPGVPLPTVPSSWLNGTADNPAPVLAGDFSRNMLTLALPKFAGKNIIPIQADAMHLPFPDSSLDLVTFAFGFRNLNDYPGGLRELHRVLRPGGQIAILECNQPGGLVGALYNLYFHYVLPTVGAPASRDRRR